MLVPVCYAPLLCSVVRPDVKYIGMQKPQILMRLAANLGNLLRPRQTHLPALQTLRHCS